MRVKCPAIDGNHLYSADGLKRGVAVNLVIEIDRHIVCQRRDTRSKFGRQCLDGLRMRLYVSCKKSQKCLNNRVFITISTGNSDAAIDHVERNAPRSDEHTS